VSIAVVIALVILADGGLRLAARSFPPSDDWNNWEATNKVEAMHALAKRGGADVVLVGSSMVNAAGDPALMTRVIASGRPVFNAALNGAGLEVLDFWTGVAAKILRPRVVVIGLSSRELNDLASEPVRMEKTMASSEEGRRVAPDRSLKDRIYGLASDVSALVRYRYVLRDPRSVSRTDPGRIRGAVGPLGVLAALKAFQSHPYSITPRFRGLVVHQTIVPYSAGRKQIDLLAHIVKTLTEMHIRVVIVKMPVSADLPPLHEHGAADYRAFETVLGDFVRTHPAVRFIDMASRITTTAEFRDPYHLNAKGREDWSRAVAQILRNR